MSDARDDDRDDNGLWGVADRERFRAAADGLAEAVRVHAETLLGMASRPAEVPLLFEANDVLARAAASYAGAQLALSGTDWPFGPVREELGEDAEEDEAGEDEEAGAEEAGADLDLDDVDEGDEEEADEDEVEVPEVARFSLLRRADYRVTDRDDLIEAGRRAAEEVEPEDADDDAEAEGMDGFTQAVYQLIHAGGPEALDLTPGLEREGATTWIVDAEERELLGDHEDPDDWPEDPFIVADDETIVFRLDEVDL